MDISIREFIIFIATLFIGLLVCIAFLAILYFIPAVTGLTVTKLLSIGTEFCNKNDPAHHWGGCFATGVVIWGCVIGFICAMFIILYTLLKTCGVNVHCNNKRYFLVNEK